MSLVIVTLLTLVFLGRWHKVVPEMVWTYQNDLSEHCRRRVMPSVFLGEQVVDSNAQMLHFSPLELPYSCVITVRTEAGNNIILVISLSSKETLSKSCQKNSNQLLVFEMGETFGGYWGPLSNRILHKDVKETVNETERERASKTAVNYTLKTTQKSTTTTPQPTPKMLSYDFENSDSESNSDDEMTTTTTTKHTLSTEEKAEEEDDGFVVEVPLVNLSLHVEPSDHVYYRPKEDEFDEAFDLLHDVMPRPDEKYISTIVPIVQLSLENDQGLHGDQRRFQLDYDLDAGYPYRRKHNKIRTTRERLFHAATRPFYRRKLIESRKSTAATKFDKRMKPSKRPRYSTYSYRYSSSNKARVDAHKLETSFENKYQDNRPQLTSNDRSTASTGMKERTRTDSWQHVVDLMKSMKTITEDVREKEPEKGNATDSKVKEKISDMKHHNTSIYLQPDLHSYVKDEEHAMEFSMLPVSTQFNLSMFTRTPLKFSSATDAPFSTYMKPSITIFDTILKENISKSENGDFKISDKTYTSRTESSTSETSEYISTFSETDEYLTNAAQDPGENAEISENINKDANNSITDGGSSDDYDSMQEMSEGQKNLTEKLNQIKYINDNQLTTKTSEIHKTKIIDTRIESLEPIMDAITVDHESWENVVQAVPKIAEVLNQTNKQEDSIKNVKKRKVDSIPIVNAKPHRRTTNKTAKPLRFRSRDSIAAVLASELEPVDDEMHGHVDLRHILKYVGPVYFNICNSQDPKVNRQVKLFNSSKIVLALVNFTLDQMTIVTTTAHRLDRADLPCSDSHLECQIEGSRVCIDSTCACDNVPNCGSYEIYDEDRLQCGSDDGHKHNVYLAAFTFIAVIFTMLYTVLYWLRRCVPRVSEAFFVYTAGTENVLYLDSIMRSPTDYDNASKLVYTGEFLEDDLLLDDTEEIGLFRKLWNLCTLKCRKKRSFSEENGTRRHSEVRQMYSFAQLELKKMSKVQNVLDIGVQTGESLEMAEISQEHGKREFMEHRLRMEKTPVRNMEGDSSVSDFGEIMNVMDIPRQKRETRDINELKELNELKILKVLNEAKEAKASSDSTQSQTIDTSGQSLPIDETELRTTDYDNRPTEKTIEEPKPSNITRMQKKRAHTISAKKHLRFETTPTAIPSTSALYEDEEDVPDLTNRRQSVMLGPTRPRRGRIGLGKSEEDSGQGQSNTALDFKRFWSKKTTEKKKQNQTKRKFNQ